MHHQDSRALSGNGIIVGQIARHACAILFVVNGLRFQLGLYRGMQKHPHHQDEQS